MANAILVTVANIVSHIVIYSTDIKLCDFGISGQLIGEWQ